MPRYVVLMCPAMNCLSSQSSLLAFERTGNLFLFVFVVIVAVVVVIVVVVVLSLLGKSAFGQMKW